MTTDLLPKSLRQAVEGDFVPVKPLPPAWQRTLVVMAVMTVGIAVAVIGFKLSMRPDIGEIPMWLGWGCTLLQLAVGIVLVSMALREAVPGNGVPIGTAFLGIGTAIVMQIVVGIATWMHSPGVPWGSDAITASIGCVTHDSAMVVPTLAVTLWLVFRVLPVRAPIAGLLGGAGAALTADAITHLLCPMSDLRHVLVWHTGALLGFMLIGWLAGSAWERSRLERL